MKKPIDLRHPYIFYMGHLPAFLDIQISKATGEPLLNNYFAQIFERGIDPIVEDPSICHAHSAVPDQWPCYEDIIAFRDTVWAKCRDLLKSTDKKVIRALNMSYEHEAMHLEVIRTK